MKSSTCHKRNCSAISSSVSVSCPYFVCHTSSHDAGVWDAKITTLPGAYLFAALVHSFLGPLGVPVCSVSGLRLLASVCVGVTGAIASACVGQLAILRHPHLTWRSPLVWFPAMLGGMAVSFYPPLAMCGTLWYTDGPATLTLLASLWLSLKDQHSAAAALAGLAVLCRQTNAVWMLVVAVSASLRALPPSPDAPTSIVTAAVRVLSHLPSLWRVVVPYALVFCGFAAFVVANGSIVVGDHENHAMTFHFAQAGYAWIMSSVMVLPVALESLPAWGSAGMEVLAGRCLPCGASSAVSRVRRALDRANDPDTVTVSDAPIRGGRVCAWGTRVLVLLLLGVVASVGGFYGTLDHPFLLADNRHSMFYVWRWFLKDRPALWASLGPVYVASLVLLASAWTFTRGPARLADGMVVFDAVVLASVLALAGAPLAEPRYWTPLVVLTIIHTPPPRRRFGVVSYSVLVLAMFGVHCAMMSLFLWGWFTWGDGSVARFMW
jgi:alpha-1,2-glucosyltransferase